jgi:hypothetical protein
MTLETKGTIKYDPEFKPGDAEYTIECKPLGILSGASGDLDSMIDELTDAVRRAIQEEFHIAGCNVHLSKYSMTCTFDVSAPVHRTLDQFTDIALKVAAKPDGAKIVDTAATIMKISEETGIPPMEVLKTAKAKLDAQKKKGAK